MGTSSQKVAWYSWELGIENGDKIPSEKNGMIKTGSIKKWENSDLKMLIFKESKNKLECST